ncbi:MAG TPA: hypothetical protein DEB43_06935 [Desulfovibrio sp.]|nr:hypothetical protein [Desulfovibrio sp.]
MFDKKTEEEKNEQKLKDTIIQNEQFKNFELYKKYVEPLYSKTFELVKNLCILCIVVNGTTLLTAISMSSPELLPVINWSYKSIFLVFYYLIGVLSANLFILPLFCFNLFPKIRIKNYLGIAYRSLFFINILSFIFILIQIFLLVYNIDKVINYFL